MENREWGMENKGKYLDFHFQIGKKVHSDEKCTSQIH